MTSVHANVQKFVDKYFLPHFHHHLQKQLCNHQNRGKNFSCHLCELNSSENAGRQYLINQDDIDLLELMNPKNTAEDYMRNILKLSKKEENIHGAAKWKEASKIVPTTRKIIATKTAIKKPLPLIEFNEQEEYAEQQQKKQQYFDRQQITRMQQQCFIRLGKLIVIRKQTTNTIELTKANYHTRQFLLGRVKEQVDRLCKDGSSKEQREFYLMACANSRGIYFQTQKMPPHLGQVLEFSEFREITCTLNEIIQRTAYQYRLESGGTKKVSPLFVVVWIVMITIVSLMIINGLLVFSQVMAIFSLVASICIVLFILMFNCHRYRQKLSYIPLLDVINLKISDYLDYLNSRPNNELRWEAANHLYWIKITEKKL